MHCIARAIVAAASLLLASAFLLDAAAAPRSESTNMCSAAAYNSCVALAGAKLTKYPTTSARDGMATMTPIRSAQARSDTRSEKTRVATKPKELPKPEPCERCCVVGCDACSCARPGLEDASRAQTGAAVPKAGATCRFEPALNEAVRADKSDLDAYFNLEGVKDCDKFMSSLRRQRIAIRARLNKGEEPTQEMVDLSEQYNSLCMSAVARVYKPVLTDQDRARIAERTVFLVDKRGQVECHGFRMNEYVLTAKHCLTELSPAVRSANGRTFKTDVVILDKQNPARAGDYVLLRIRDYDLGKDESEIEWLGEPHSQGRLAILQSNIYRRISDNSQANLDLTSSLALEDNPVCRLYGISSEGYLFHACQTEWGTSGAGYFQRDSAGRLRLVGIHSGATRGLRAPELNACKSRLANYGVRLPVAALR